MSSLLLRVREEIRRGEGGGGGGMTLPVLLGIAIGGGVLLFICLAFLLIALAGRRHRARVQARSTTPAARAENESASEECLPHTPSPRPRRLKKPMPEQTYTDMAEIQGQPHRSLSSIISVPRSKTFNGFSTPSEASSGHRRGGHMRKNNSWIDEDAIHGPKVQNDGKRLSIRDSFILRTPTLPDLLLGFKEEPKGQVDQSGYPVQHPQPASLSSQRGQPQRLSLPRTASYEMAEKIAAAARGSVPPSPQQQGPRVVPLPRPRQKTTETDLAEILRSTEQRLQSGTPSNSRPVTRQRGTSVSAGSSVRTPQTSPTKSHSPTRSQSPTKPPQSPVKSQSPARYQVITHVGQAVDINVKRRTRTPSPQKRIVIPGVVQTPGRKHKVEISQSPAVSDADSLFGESTPEIDQILPTGGLSSPSRRAEYESGADGNKLVEKCLKNGSPDSDVSSSLSTLYSVDEPEDDSKTGGTRQPAGMMRGGKPGGLVIHTRMCDPFVTTAAPKLPSRSPNRQSLPSIRCITPLDEKLVIDASFQSNELPVQQGAAKHRGTADKDQTRYSIMMHVPDLAPSPDAIRPRSVVTNKPVVLVASTTVSSMKASPSTSPEDNNNNNTEEANSRLTFGQKGIVVPPPLNLRPGQGSPNRIVRVMGSPDGKILVVQGEAPPTIRTVHDTADGSGPSAPGSPTRRPPQQPGPNMPGELKHKSPTPARYKRQGMANPMHENVMSRPPSTSTLNRPPSTSTLNRPPSTSTLSRQPSTSVMSRQPSTSTLNRQPSNPTLHRQSSNPTLNRQPSNPMLNRQSSNSTLNRQSSNSTLNRQPSNPTLNRQPSNPTLNRQSSNPTLNRQSSNPMLNRQPSNPTLNRQPSNPMLNRQPSTSMMSRQPSMSANHRVGRVLSRSNCPAIVLKPSSSPRRSFCERDFGVQGLQSTVAQLRRMNSQMSTFSVASTVSDPDSPSLPNFRGGGFSPDRSNSRVSKIGRQNYLSLGVMPKSQRNSRSSIKSARNSIAVLKGKPGANKHLDSLQAAIQEKEAESRSTTTVRGPRPLNPTPRSAGRSGTRTSTAPHESPTRRRSGRFKAEEHARLEKPGRHQIVAHDSATSLGVYDKDRYLLGGQGVPAARAQRHGPGRRV